jgi:hypothetical protein
MVPFHIYIRLEGSRALVPWKFHGKEFQMSNIVHDFCIIKMTKLAKNNINSKVPFNIIYFYHPLH